MEPTPELGPGENPYEHIDARKPTGEIAPPMFNPKTIAYILVGAAIGAAIGYFSIESINSIGGNPIITPETFTFVKILAITLGAMMGGATAGAAAQESRGNRT